MRARIKEERKKRGPAIRPPCQLRANISFSQTHIITSGKQKKIACLCVCWPPRIMSQTYDARGTDRSITVRPSQAGLGMVECCHIHIVMLLFLIQAKQILRWRNTHTDTHGSRCQAACGRAAAAAAFSPSTRGAWGKKRYKKNNERWQVKVWTGQCRGSQHLAKDKTRRRAAGKEKRTTTF